VVARDLDADVPHLQGAKQADVRNGPWLRWKGGMGGTALAHCDKGRGAVVDDARALCAEAHAQLLSRGEVVAVEVRHLKRAAGTGQEGGLA